MEAPSLTLLAAVLLVAGSVLGAALAGVPATDDPAVASSPDDGSGTADDADVAAVDAAPCTTSAEAPAFPDGTTAETWTGQVADGVAEGVLDLRSYDGGITLATWDEPGWEVQVAEDDPDDRLEATVEDHVADGVWTLTVEVEDTGGIEQGPASVDVGEDADAHLRVMVPDLLFETVELRDRPASNGSTINVQASVGVPDDPTAPNASEPTMPVWVRDLRVGELAVDVHDEPVEAANVTATGDVSLGTHDGAVTLHDATVGTVHLGTHEGDACASSVDADELALGTHDGNVRVADAVAPEASLGTHEGDVTTVGLRATDVSLATHDGAVDADVVPLASGSIAAGSHEGDVTVHLPVGGPFGYDATASTHEGDARIDLGEASADGGGPNGSADARTPGYEEKQRQVTVDASTHDGDAMVLER